MICYSVGSSGQMIVFTREVIEHFEQHRQHRFWHKEAGGLIFAELSSPEIIVAAATGPRPTDSRGRYSYHPDRRAEQQEINSYYADGLHFVGEWHTHPERIPRPSTLDKKTMTEAVRKSQHDLNGFLLVIVGQADFPDGLHVSIFNEETYFPLSM